MAEEKKRQTKERKNHNNIEKKFKLFKRSKILKQNDQQLKSIFIFKVLEMRTFMVGIHFAAHFKKSIILLHEDLILILIYEWMFDSDCDDECAAQISMG